MTEMACPACGKTINVQDQAKHVVRDCKPFEAARSDAKNPTSQSRLRQQTRQDILVRKGQSFSEKYSENVLDSPFMRRHWLFVSVSTSLLCWLVGYETPSYNYAFTIIVAPLSISSFIILSAKWSWVSKKLLHR